VSQYAIVIEGDGSTNYSAYAPDLPGVVVTGDSLEECKAEMREAIEFHIEGLRLAGEPVPPASTASSSTFARSAPRTPRDTVAWSSR
jgi:predicted RNase H-like HicB family nuclease